MKNKFIMFMIVFGIMNLSSVIHAEYAYPPLLGDSFKGYNRFLKTNSCPNCFVPGITLMVESRPRANLQGAVMFNSSLVLSVLNNSNLSHANLENAWMHAAHINVSNFSCANLTNVVAEDAFLVNCVFDCAILDSATFHSVNMSKSRFVKTSMLNTNLANATLTLTQFKNADLTGSTLNGANFSNSKVFHSNFTDASMKKVKAKQANFTGSTFFRTKLYEAVFTRSNLTSTNFTRALMYRFMGDYCNFTNANLTYAELIDADLQFSNFKGATTEHANFTGAILLGATNFEPAESAILCQTIMPDGSANNSGCHRIDQYLKDLVEIDNLESESAGHALHIRPDFQTASTKQLESMTQASEGKYSNGTMPAFDPIVKPS
ncbi:hypothetical protein HOM50_03590 [bacterium]|jgi:uncharacterized protein YjbI with pentapeptide repeats|nr:hypothetical protein [bacterium]MBT5015461.1 hypothetical protein [bacterium]